MAAKASAPTKVIWIPRHTGLTGNEMADNLARRERTSPENSSTPTGSLTIAAIGRKSSELSRQLLKDRWVSHRPKRYADLDLKMRRKKPPELALPRALYARLKAVRAGHGDFTAYYSRFNRTTAELHCACRRENSASYLVQCTNALSAWRLNSGRRWAPALEALPGSSGWRLFEEYIK